MVQEFILNNQFSNAKPTPAPKSLLSKDKKSLFQMKMILSFFMLIKPMPLCTGLIIHTIHSQVCLTVIEHRARLMLNPCFNIN